MNASPTRCSKSVGELAEDYAGLEEAVLGGFVVPGFYRVFAFLLKLFCGEELFSLRVVDRAVVAHVCEFERYHLFQLHEIRRRRARIRRISSGYRGSNRNQRGEKLQTRSHRDRIVMEPNEIFQRTQIAALSDGAALEAVLAGYPAGIFG